MTIIRLNEMKFHAHHGFFDFEKQLGNTFVVDVSMVLNTDLAQQSDNLDDTLNYQEVYDVVKQEMEISSNLLEHVIQRIFSSIKNNFPQIKHLKVKLSKLNPPLGGAVESVSIELED